MQCQWERGTFSLAVVVVKVFGINLVKFFFLEHSFFGLPFDDLPLNGNYYSVNSMDKLN